MWLGAPEGPSDAIQIRPDVLLTDLCLVAGFFIARAVQTRGVWWFVSAALTIGFALTVKIHAVGLLVPLVVAVALRHPAAEWTASFRSQVAATWRRRRVRVVGACAVALWLGLLLRYTLPHAPFHGISRYGVYTAAELLLVVGVYTAVSVGFPFTPPRRFRRFFDPFYALIAFALTLGVLIPLSVLGDTGFAALAAMRHSLSGSGINSGITAFNGSVDVSIFPLRQAFVVFGVAVAAAVVGAIVRDLPPIMWFLGATSLGALAAARLGSVHYFAPPFALSVVGAVWFCRRIGKVGIVLAAALTLYVVVPQLQHRHDDAVGAAEGVRLSEQTIDRTSPLLKAGQVAVLPDHWSNADESFFEVVQEYLDWFAPYPYRYIPDWTYAAAVVRNLGFTPAYYVGPSALSISKPQTLELQAGTFRAVPLPKLATTSFGVVRLTPAP